MSVYRAIYILAVSLSFGLVRSAVVRSQDVEGQLKTRSPMAIGEPVLMDRTAKFSAMPLRSLSIDLGKLEVGSTVKLRLKLENDSGRDFEINTVEVESACTLVESPPKVVRAGEVTELAILLKVPAFNSSARVIKSVGLKQSEEKQYSFRLEFELSGVCCFAERSASVNAPMGSESLVFRVPVVVTYPVDRSNVKVFGTGGLSKIDATLESIDAATFVRCQLSVPLSDSFMLSGSLVLKNPLTDSTEMFECLVAREQQVIVSPSVVRLVRSGGKLRGSVMIRLNREIVQSSKEKIVLDVAPSLEGVKLSVEQKSIGSGLNRVQIEIEEKEVIDKSGKVLIPEKIRWQVSWGAGLAELDSRILP